MTRTTELLKGCKGTLDYLTQDEVVEINGVCRENCLCDKCESKLRGRLDALKEEVEFLNEIKCRRKSWCIKNSPTWQFHIEKKLASIQEEIKLIEEKI